MWSRVSLSRSLSLSLSVQLCPAIVWARSGPESENLIDVHVHQLGILCDGVYTSYSPGAPKKWLPPSASVMSLSDPQPTLSDNSGRSRERDPPKEIPRQAGSVTPGVGTLLEPVGSCTSELPLHGRSSLIQHVCLYKASLELIQHGTFGKAMRNPSFVHPVQDILRALGLFQPSPTARPSRLSDPSAPLNGSFLASHLASEHLRIWEVHGQIRKAMAARIIWRMQKQPDATSQPKITVYRKMC